MNRTIARFRHPLPLSVALLALALPLAAQPAADDPVAALRHELGELRQAYEARIAALEERLRLLEEEASPVAEDALERLRSLAQQVAEEPAPARPIATPAEPTVGRGNNLNRLNPEISATGIVLGLGSSQGREEFKAQEFELDVQSSLDPFSKMRLTVALNDEGEAEIEEGYVLYSALPAGLALTVGRFRQTFGPLNRQHLHALPQSDYPLVFQSFFGEEGLAQTGVSLDWLLPHPWASAGELTLQLTDGANEAFGGDDFEHLSLLAHLKSFWDLSDATWMEWGLSGAAGESQAGGRSSVLGTDLTLHWQPPARAKYRELTWRSELLRSQRDDFAGVEQVAWGGYSYLEGTVAQNLSLGLRYDHAEDPLSPGDRRWALVPYVTWWQSEFVRLRGELRRVVSEPTGHAENQLVLQIVWAAGPHKHETY